MFTVVGTTGMKLRLFQLQYRFQASTPADLGGGGGCPSPLGIRTPADPKSPPVVLISDIEFWLIDHKYFLRAPK